MSFLTTFNKIYHHTSSKYTLFNYKPTTVYCFVYCNLYHRLVTANHKDKKKNQPTMDGYTHHNL